MTSYIFHGPALLEKNAKILQIKKDFEPLEINEYFGRDFTWVQIKGEVLSGGLFTDRRLVILEDFSDIDLNNLPDNPELTLVIKFSKQLPTNSNLLKHLPKDIQVMSFPEEKETSIFPFLDLVSEKNPKALKVLEQYLDEWGSQYVLTMLGYCLRRFVQKKKDAPVFVQRKMDYQRKNFPESRLNDLYLKIIETDFKIKQGLIDERLGLYLLTESFFH